MKNPAVRITSMYRVAVIGAGVIGQTHVSRARWGSTACAGVEMA